MGSWDPYAESVEARYTVMATLAGVLFALILGMAGFTIGGYQAWVGYQQWQHPVDQGH